MPEIQVLIVDTPWNSGRPVMTRRSVE